MPTAESMPLSVFIERHHSEIVGEFSAFAPTLMPSGSAMPEADWRDRAGELLTAIAQDLNTGQTALEPPRLHAAGGMQHGCSLAQVQAEFRALRGSVLKLYELTGHADSAGVRRFNEAIDDALTESMTRYSAKTDRSRDQFVGMVSHDLRNPLGAITAGAALLAASADADKRQAGIAGRILDSAQRMQRMIADLLDVTRIRLGGAIPLKRARTDLQKVCEDVVLELQAYHTDAVVHCTSTGNVTGEWDADRLAQVVSNLVGNAIEHGGQGPVTVEAVDAGDRVRLTVHNAGEPIAREAQATIFEPLTRGAGDPNGNIGLGLFIARAIVVAHGGEIRLTSAEQSGTTFEVVLPR
jgi:signal transduction histidine kinase